MSNPFISVIVPCRNEEEFISRCLDSIINNTYPHNLMEILVVDGISVDRTPSIVQSYHKKLNFIRLIENPKKNFPAAVNIGIKESIGELIFIAGAHAVYDKNYIKACVDNSYKYNADNTGGILITREQGNTFIGKVITFVLSNRFGVGNSTFRTGSTQIIEVDTVFGGCYKRNVFKNIGYFNETLISTSDYEFNKRLRNNGGKIILDPKIKAAYYTRTTFKKFIANNFRNGFWAIYPINLVEYIPVSTRHFVPLLFVLTLVLTMLLSIFYHPFVFMLLVILGSYFIFSFVFTILSTRNPVKILVVPFFFLQLHITYGIGSSWALMKIILTKFKLLRK